MRFFELWGRNPAGTEWLLNSFHSQDDADRMARYNHDKYRMYDIQYYVVDTSPGQEVEK